MTKRIEIHEEARLDLSESFGWYQQRSEKAALGFTAAFDDSLEKIIKNPSRYPKLRFGCQYCALQNYPFRVIFRSLPDRLDILAVAHSKRRSNYWSNRL